MSKIAKQLRYIKSDESNDQINSISTITITKTANSINETVNLNSKPNYHRLD